MAAVRLSVLDLVPVGLDLTPAEALTASTALAGTVEALGYYRYWVAEHHSQPDTASSVPAVVIAHLAASTSTLRLGSGGVMLPNYAPFAIAEQFAILEALHRGRIDLGLGSAPGGLSAAARALRRPAAVDFRKDLVELLSYMDGTGDLMLTPDNSTSPQVWVLGSSAASARVAAELGLPYAFAYHLMSQSLEASLEAYRSGFVPSEKLPKPYVIVAAEVICADTSSEAERLAASARFVYLSEQRAKPIPFPRAEDALSVVYSAEDLQTLEHRTKSHIVGDRETVLNQLAALSASSQADEIMVSTHIGEPEARSRSYQLIAGFR